MVYQNISTLLLELAAINNENTIEYTGNTGNIKINCLIYYSFLFISYEISLL